MPRIAGQDGQMYDLTDDQADQYYKISDFGQQQQFLRETAGAKPAGEGAAPPVLPPRAPPPMPAALAPSPSTGNDLGISPDLRLGLIPGLRPAPALGPHASATSMAMTDPERALDLIEQYESGGKNTPNYRFDPGHTAQGNFQITNSTWRGIAPAAGIDLVKYPNAMSAPYDLQRAAARELLAQQGFGPWAPYNPRLAAAIGWGGGGSVAPSNALAPTAANTGPTISAPDRTSLGNASLAGAASPLGGPWARLLGLSLLAQSAKPQLPQVKYDPSLAMTDTPAVRLPVRPSPLGDLGGETPQVPTSRFSAPQVETPRVSVDVPVAGVALPKVAPYVTRIGMRDFWNE